MKLVLRHERGTVPIYGALIASAIVAFLSITSFLVLPVAVDHSADMRIEPNRGHVMVGDTFVVDVIVESGIPVNVFKGEVFFDPTILFVDAIDYNTSIADLWVELPWYENGEGTINFAGGTTMKGGFQGTGSLITITFKTRAAGNTALKLEGARILEHNGLGTDVTLQKPLDAFFAVGEEVIASHTVASPKVSSVSLAVTPEPPTTDVNSDGKQTLADVSMFMLNMLGNDSRFDFNLDGVVDTKDMSIIMNAR